jgi:hypothetical protein
MYLYSSITNGFYKTGIHDAAIPLDVVEITDDEHAALLEAQARGQVIQADASGKPVAVALPRPTDEQLATSIRAERDAKLAACDWTQIADAPLSAEVKAAWATYRQALRDVTAQETFPASVTWPEEPGV